jgi:hypothetical protein
MPQRWEKIADVIGTRSFKDVCAKAKERAGPARSQVGVGSIPAPTARGASNRADQPVSRISSPSAPAANDATVAAAAWTKEEQCALETSLATYPASMEKGERWSAIAAAVGSKTKTECVQRYKFLAQQLKSNKAE